MRSKVAEDARAALHREMMALSVEERLQIALRLGDEAVALDAAAEGLTLEESRRTLMRHSQMGRRPSKVASD